MRDVECRAFEAGETTTTPTTTTKKMTTKTASLLLACRARESKGRCVKQTCEFDRGI